MTRGQAIGHRLLRFAARPGDTDDQAFKNALALATAIACCAAGLVWSAMYYVAIGPGITMALPLLFVGIVGSSMVVSARIADPRPLVYALLACITWISALIQWSIGSASGAGMVIAWSFLGPIGALMFLSLRKSFVWLAMFLIIVFVSAVLDPALLGAPIPVSDGVSALFLLMNVSVSLSVVFAAAAWFMRSLELERSRLVELTAFLKKTFGRFQSDQVLEAIIDDPSAAGATGARQAVTIVMTDLRGFTALCERRSAEEVVEMLNLYLAAMADVVEAYGGAINAISGDGLLVTFGAPRPMDDRVETALACAIRMQNAMQGVNGELASRGLPALAMGIGIHDGEVVVGTIGSEKRAMYGVIGSGVNTASRIESNATGGQILVSQTVYDALGPALRVDGRRELLPKGSESAIAVYDVGGIGGRHQLSVQRKAEPLVALSRPILARAVVVEGKVAEDRVHELRITHLSRSEARFACPTALTGQKSLKLNLCDVPERLQLCSAYANVTQRDGDRCRITFTSIAPEIEAYLVASLQMAEA